MQLQ
jgi:hypothetical protein